MSLQGTLRQLGLAEVLQTAVAGRQGNLYLRNGPTHAVLHVASNQLRLIDPDPVDPDTMLEGFAYRGLLDGDVLREAQERRDVPRDRVDLLIESGALPRPEVDTLLRAAAEDAILDFLTWQKGDFRFEEGEPPADDNLVSRVAVDLGGILLRAAQRLDEWAAITDRLGMEAHLFLAIGAPPEPSEEDDLAPLIHNLLDGTRVIEEISLLAGIPRFAALRVILELVGQGRVRSAEPEELGLAVDARLAAEQPQVARSLLLQWSGRAPGDPTPLQRLAELARSRKKSNEEADAQLALSQLFMHQGKPQEALGFLKDLADRRPGDGRVLTALSAAAEVAGDTETAARATVQLAAQALKEDEAQRAAQLLRRITSQPDAPLAARVLRARALVRLRDRDGLVEEAEAAATGIRLNRRTRDEREAASYFRDAIATLAPERSDLLRHFRGGGAPTNSGRKVALLVALLALAGVAGFVLWPKGPRALLERANAAANTGDQAEALRLIAVLAEEHPDAPETSEAFLLQARLLAARTPTRPSGGNSQASGSGAVSGAIEACESSLPALPRAEAVACLRELAQHLHTKEGRPHRQRALQHVEKDLQYAATRLVREVRRRVDALAHVGELSERPSVHLTDIRPWVVQAQAYLTDDHPTQLEATFEAVSGLFDVEPSEPQARILRELQEAVSRMKRARSQFAKGVDAGRRRVASLEVDEAYRLCRTDASRHLVAGRFDEADALYTKLGGLLVALESDSLLEPVLADARRRRLPAFVEDRRRVISEIRLGLKSAMAAEQAGDLESAVRAYTSLAQRFWHIRFESVVQLPLRLQSTPTGSKVLLNGQPAGTTPTVVHYPWGSPVTLVVEAPGFEPATRFLDPTQEAAPSLLDVQLAPRRLWNAPLPATGVTAPIAVGGDVVFCDRTGRIQRLSGTDGRVQWVRQIDTLEGIKHRPLVLGRQLHVLFVDGALLTLDLDDGRRVGETNIGRPMGEAAVLNDDIGVAVLDGRLRVIQGPERVMDVPLGGPPARAGVLAAHGAFWVGTADGNVIRHQVRGSTQRISFPGRQAAVAGLAAHPKGVVVSRSDGSLYALDASGRSAWNVESLGHLTGAPAVVGDVVSIVDSRGHVLTFALRDGAPKGQVDLESEAPHGLMRLGGLLIARLSDGRLWIYEPGTERVLANVGVGGVPGWPVVQLWQNVVAVPTSEGLTLFDLPVAEAPKR